RGRSGAAPSGAPGSATPTPRNPSSCPPHLAIRGMASLQPVLTPLRPSASRPPLTRPTRPGPSAPGAGFARASAGGNRGVAEAPPSVLAVGVVVADDEVPLLPTGRGEAAPEERLGRLARHAAPVGGIGRRTGGAAGGQPGPQAARDDPDHQPPAP